MKQKTRQSHRLAFAMLGSILIASCSGPSGAPASVPPVAPSPSSGGGGSPPPPPPPPPSGPQAGSEIKVDDLNIGDCADSGNSSVLYSVVIMDCTAAHEFEVIGKYDRPEGTSAAFPGRVEMLPEARNTCRDVFFDLTGKAIDGLGLEIDVMYPSSSTWELGDREIICIAQAMEGEPPLARPVSDF